MKKGIAETVEIRYRGPFEYMSTDGSDLSGIRKEIKLPETVEAPVEKDGIAGKAVYTLNGKEIGSVDILYKDSVAAAGYKDNFLKTLLFFVP